MGCKKCLKSNNEFFGSAKEARYVSKALTGNTVTTAYSNLVNLKPPATITPFNKKT